jgi:uncharacterized membrane protein
VSAQAADPIGLGPSPSVDLEVELGSRGSDRAHVRNINFASWFLGLALAVGIFLVFTQPPGQGLDEQNHFLRTWTLAHGAIVAPIVHGRAGGQVPLCITHYFSHFQQYSLSTKAFSIDQYWHVPRACNTTARFTSFDNTALNSPIPYVPTAVIVALLRALGGSLPLVFFGGRLAALLAYVAIAYTAIRIAPVGKQVLFVVGLFPTTLLLASSYSEDTMSISLSMLAVALTLHCCRSANANRRSFLILVAVLAALALAKSTMIVVFPLVFVVPLSVFGESRRPRLQQWCAAGLIVLFAMIWYSIARNISLDSYLPAGPGHPLQPHVQQAYVLHHPVGFLVILLRSIFLGQNQYYPVSGYFAAIGYYRPTVKDGNFAPLGLVALGTAVLTCSYAAMTGSRRSLSNSERVLAWYPVVLTIAGTLLIEIAFWVYWTPPGWRSILGVQGRYFLALTVFPAITVGIFREPRTPTIFSRFILGGTMIGLVWIVLKVLSHDFGV